jgi:flagellar hook-length control protein FliK
LDFVAVIAANSVTNNSPASAASSSTPATGDAFAAILDQLAQELTNGLAVASADAASSTSPTSAADAGMPDPAGTTAATPADPAGSTAAATDPMLTQLIAAQQAVNAPPATSTPVKSDPANVTAQPGSAKAPAPATATPVPDVTALQAAADRQTNTANAHEPGPQAIVEALPQAAPVAKADLPPTTTAKTDLSAAPNAKTDPQAAPVGESAQRPALAAKAEPVAKAEQPDNTDAPAAPAKADPNISAKPALRQESARDASRLPGERAALHHQHMPAEAPRPSDPSPADAPTSAAVANDPVQNVPAPSAPAQAADTNAPAAVSATDTPAVASAPAQPVAVPPAPADAVTVETVAAALPMTDQAASAVAVSGTISKPAKAVNGVASSDNGKNEDRSSKASTLADASDVARRGFASEPVVRASALPVQSKAGDADKPSDGAAAQPQQHNAANPVAAATPAQQASPSTEPVQVSAAPTQAHVQATPQPDPNVSIATVNGGASPTQTPAVPAHIAAQIQVAQHTPDINALAVNIAAKSEDGQKHFDIRLDPAELGRVDVRLTVDDAGKAQAMLTVEKPQTLELLQKDQTHLERALKDAGLDLTQNGLSFSLKGQQQQQHTAQDHAPFARGQRLAARAVVAATQDITPTLSTGGIAASDTRLDIRV